MEASIKDEIVQVRACVCVCAQPSATNAWIQIFDLSTQRV